MLLKFSKTSDATSKFVSIAVYGEPGIGKTTLAKTLGVADDRVLFLSADRGHISVCDKNFTMVHKLANDAEMAEFAAYVEAEAKAGKIDWVFVDGLDTMADDLVERERAWEAKQDKPNQYGPYDRLYSKGRAFIMRIQGAACNSLFTFQMARDDKSATPYSFAFPGIKLNDKLMAYFDNVLPMRLVTLVDGGKTITKRLLQTRRDGGGDRQYESKCRDPFKRIAAYEEPNIAALVEKMTKPAAPAV